MPYSRVEDLPSAVRGKLKGKKLRQWMHVFDSAYDRHGDESRAFAEAWATAQKLGKASDMSDFSFFLPIAKVDKEKRTVSGYASTPTKDSDGEIVTLEAVRAALPEYMEYGNIREMHALKAVGVAKEANMDTKGLFLTGKIVDDSAWNKCLEGVYKGFSIGGRKLAKEGDKITEIELTEISVVDRPANPDCKITLAKSKKLAEGGYLVRIKKEKTPEQRALVKMAKAVEALAKDGPPAARDGLSLPAGPIDKAIPEPTIPTKEPDGVDSIKDSRPEENVTRKTEPDTTKGGDMPGVGSHPYGDVEYADPGYQSDKKKRYPVDTKKHIRAAWNYINKPKNAAKYGDKASAVRSKIVSAWKSVIDPKGPPSLSAKKVKKLRKMEERLALTEFLNLKKEASPALEISGKEDKFSQFDLKKSREDRNMEENTEVKEVENTSTGDPLMDALAKLMKGAGEPSLTKRLGMATDNVSKARKAMKECRKAIEQAHKMHKAAYFAKANGKKPDSDSNDDGFDHAGAMEKLQKAYGELDKARVFGKAAIGDIAKASGRVGQRGQETGDGDAPYYTVPQGVKDLAMSELTGAGPGTPGGGGQPPAYPGDGSVYPGKAGGASDDLRKYAKNGHVPAEIVELLIAKGKSDAELEALRRVSASSGRRPYAFDITKAVGGPGAGQSPDNRTLFDGVDPNAIGSGDEMAHTAASARVIGNMLTSGRFGKSVMDPTFKGAAGSK